ncbi:unnamed protein product [Rhodiola kirilowii]
MKRKHPKNGTNEVNEVEVGIKHEIRKSSGGVKLGDLIWVKLHPSSWWPAQVIDADTVSEEIKPCERSVGEVLVRVYGSYIYLYVDPSESRFEFDKTLTLYNGDYHQILKESLDKDRPHSSKSKKLKVSEESQSTGEVGNEKVSDVRLEEENNKQGKEEGDLSETRITDNVPKQKGRKLRSAKNNKRAKQNTIMVENETSLQKRVSPRLKLASNKLETYSENGNLKSEVSSGTDVQKACATKQKSHSETAENKAAHLDKKNTGKGDNNLSSPCKAVVPNGEHPKASARSKKIMQSLGLIAPSGSPFSF